MKFLLKIFVLLSLIGLSKITKEDTVALQKAVIPAAKVNSEASYAQETEKATLLNDQPVSATRARFQKTSLRLN